MHSSVPPTSTCNPINRAPNQKDDFPVSDHNSRPLTRTTNPNPNHFPTDHTQIPDVTRHLTMAPTTRKSSRASAGPGKQQTLSFKNKVTKSIKTGKEDYKSPSRAKEYIPEGSPTPHSQQTTEPPVSPTTPTLGRGKAELAAGAPKLRRQAGPQTVVVEKPEMERRAERVSKAAVEKYWGGIEKSRLARAVHAKHAEGLSTGEKVLRYFDVSSQYGVGSLLFLRFSRCQDWCFGGDLANVVGCLALHRDSARQAMAAGAEIGSESAD